MFLKKIDLFNFKSYEELTLNFGEGLNLILGLNGSGKTNILDAIYYSCMTKAFSGLTDQQLIRHQEAFFVLKTHHQTGDEISASFKIGGKKQFLLNKKPYKSMAQHIGQYPVVFVSPNDHDYIRDSAETRRKFFDEFFCQVSREYLMAQIKYNKVLKQRNQLLKQFKTNLSFDLDLLHVFDEQLEPLNTILSDFRQKALGELVPILSGYYQLISSGKEEINLRYLNDRSTGDYHTQMATRLEKDRLLARTNFGVHKDDYDFLIGEAPIKKYGSQGQQKSFMLSLQLAKFEFLKSKLGKIPFLLLDDVFDKLDHERISRLLELIDLGSFGQVFITDASQQRCEQFVDGMTTKPSIFVLNNSEAHPIE